MQPRYPEDFDQATQPSTAQDAAWPPVASDAVGADADAGPGGLNPPSAPAFLEDGGVGSGGPPSDDGGGNTPGPLSDAGVIEPEPDGIIETCTITANTDASHVTEDVGRYGCAIWIADSSNKIVKAFFEASRIFARSGLPTFRAAVSAVGEVDVDVITGATMTKPKQHWYMWDLKDASGAAVPPGGYKLQIETHSSAGVTLVTVPFDTSKAVAFEMAAPAGEVRSAAISCL